MKKLSYIVGILVFAGTVEEHLRRIITLSHQWVELIDIHLAVICGTPCNFLAV